MKNWFHRSLLSTVLICSLFAVTLPTTGCNSSTVINEINVVLTEATNVLVVAAPGTTWVPQLQSAITALKAAEQTWQNGGSVQTVINVLNTIVAITSVIPLTAQYSPLIDVLVAGIEAVLAALPPSTAVNAAVFVSPHVGRVHIKHKMFHSRTAEFKDAWNAAAASNPQLVGATIK